MQKKETVVAAENSDKKFKGPPRSAIRENFESLVITLIMALFGMTFIVQAVTVPTGSMQNTILIGDYLLVNKFIFSPGGDPVPFLPQRNIERGDIIVFKYPGFPDNDKKTEDEGGFPYKMNFVKRVIGLPGDKVEIRGTQVFINDQLLPEHRVIGDSKHPSAALTTQEFEERKPEDLHDVYYSARAVNSNSIPQDYNFGIAGTPQIVPPDSYFVMGDSRNQSLDSRYWGFVPRNLVVGRAIIVYWSCDRGASDNGFLGCLTSPRFDRIGKFIK